MKIKICGLTQEADILAINELKPDYCGFVFAKSKREVTVERAAELISGVNPSIQKVGVFVNPSLKLIEDALTIAKIDIVQLHGDETPALICELKAHFKGVIFWKALRLKDSSLEETNLLLEEIKKYQLETLLLDAWHESSYGGLGLTCDWQIAQKIAQKKRVFLAGGLTPENVEAAIKAVNPWGVDVSSGVEVDSKKDYHKISAFINKVRSMDLNRKIGV